MFPNTRRTVVLLSSFVILVFCVSSLGSLSSAYNPTPLLAPAKLANIHSVADYYSTNWAGYAINATAGSVSQVKGSWIQPAITCPSTGLEAAGFWVGIDGLTSLSVEQIGTLAVCSNGVASYFAWYEMYPSNSVNITKIIVSPGQEISATVKYSTTTSKFTLTMKDVTTGKSFSKSLADPGVVRSSAEWIAEAPEYCTAQNVCQQVSLPNFVSVSFGKDSTTVTGTDTATVSGSTKAISKFGSMVDDLSMVNQPDTAYMAQTSALSTDGTSFSIQWDSIGP